MRHIWIDTNELRAIDFIIRALATSETINLLGVSAVGGGAEALWHSLQKIYPQAVLGADRALLESRPISDKLGHAPQAVQELEKAMEKHEGIELLAFGPLTNIATWIVANPHQHARVQCIHMVSGVCLEGNQTMATEAQIAWDPEAAKIVLKSGIPVRLYPQDKSFLEAESLKLGLDPADFYGHCLAELLRGSQVAKYKKCYIDVDLQGVHTRGSLVVDYPNTLRQKANGYIFEGLTETKAGEA